MQRIPVWIIRLLKPEFWPYPLFYFPGYFYIAYRTLQLGNKFYIPVLNPAIDALGGFHKASKTHINTLFPPSLLPASIVFSPGENVEDFLQTVQLKINYPCFIKPDDQVKGIGVEQIENENALRIYLQTIHSKVLVQALLPVENEFAVFICKMPGEKLRITGLTAKKMLYITGDGKRTIGSLLEENIRYRMAKKFMFPKWNARWNEIPAKGETILIQPVGNHNKGTEFEDITARITKEMENTFNSIVPPGIHYGRFDVKATNLHSLENKEGLMIIEFNGTIAEPVNYLDPKHSFLKAQKIIFQHLQWQYRIGKKLVENGATAPGLWEGWKLARQAGRWGKESAFTFEGHLE